MDKFFNKYLNEGPSKKQEGPKTPRDAQKAVEALAAQLAVQVLDLDSKYHSKGGKLKKFIGDAEDKVQAAISKLHPDPRVISHFLNTYEKLVGKTITNEIPGRASNVIKSRANIGITIIVLKIMRMLLVKLITRYHHLTLCNTMLI